MTLRALARPAVVAILVAALLGCGGGVSLGPSAPLTSAAPSSGLPSSTASSESPSVTLDAFDQALVDVAAPGGRLATFWKASLAETTVDGQQAFAPVSPVLPYHDGELPDIECAIGDVGVNWSGNAFYCRLDQSIAYSTDLLRAFDTEIGHISPIAVMAHEWGHHIQTLLGRPENTIQRELQADCYAGMYMVASGVVANDPIGLAAALEGLETFFKVGNEKYTTAEFFRKGQHGSRQQRMMAYSTGFLPIERALAFCYGYRDLKANDFITVGPYRYLNLPGRTVTKTGDLWVSPGDPRTGLPSSTIVLTWVPNLPRAGEGATAAQLAAVFAEDPNTIPLFDVIPLDKNIRDGTAIAQYFESHPTPTSVTSGLMAIASPISMQGGLLMFVERAQAAPVEPPDDEDLHVLQEELATLHQVIARLCTPDQSPNVGDANLNTVCMDVQ